MMVLPKKNENLVATCVPHILEERPPNKAKTKYKQKGQIKRYNEFPAFRLSNARSLSLIVLHSAGLLAKQAYIEASSHCWIIRHNFHE
jgi:hypothetical protein